MPYSLVSFVSLFIFLLHSRKFRCHPRKESLQVVSSSRRMLRKNQQLYHCPTIHEFSKFSLAGWNQTWASSLVHIRCHGLHEKLLFSSKCSPRHVLLTAFPRMFDSCFEYGQTRFQRQENISQIGIKDDYSFEKSNLRLHHLVLTRWGDLDQCCRLLCWILRGVFTNCKQVRTKRCCL